MSENVYYYNEDYDTKGPRLEWQEARDFSKHPLRAYDAFASRDTNHFRSMYGKFIRFLKFESRLLITQGSSDLDARKRLAELKSMYHDVRTKVNNYGKATDTYLLPEYKYHL